MPKAVVEAILCAALVAAAAGCRTSVESHVAGVCAEAGFKPSNDPYESSDPCKMTEGQLRQWFSDHAPSPRKPQTPGAAPFPVLVLPPRVHWRAWRSLLSKADTARKVQRLWSCRGDDDDASLRGAGWQASSQHPLCVEYSSWCSAGWALDARTPTSDGSCAAGYTRLATGSVKDCEYKDCPVF